MKGQISLEYLMLTLIALVLISFSLTALFKIKEAADATHERLLFNSTVNGIYNSAEDLCALGSGNKMHMALQAVINAEANGKSVTFTLPGSTSVQEIKKVFSCDFGAFDGLNGDVEITNEDGAIIVKPA